MVPINKRRDERVCRSLPVKLGDATGITLDVSARGIFFETDASFSLGNSINFTVELDAPGGMMVLKCSGKIVRIEPRDTRQGVAVKILESTLEPV